MKPSTVTIDMKLPSLNDYIKDCRTNPIIAARKKKQIQEQISWFLAGLPHYKKKVRIDFVWEEKDARRDLDNICASRKFILDAMVEMGIITNDNRKCLGAFSDSFPKPNGKKTFVTMTISEME